MKKHLFLVLFIHFSSINAQTPFQRSYGSIGWDELFAVHPTADGNITFAGVCSGVVPYSFLLKCDPQGDTIWSRSYVCPQNAYCTSMHCTTDNGFIMSAKPQSSNHPSCVIKLDSLGHVEWGKSFSGNTYQFCMNVIPTQDHGYAAVLSVENGSNGSAEMIVVKLDGTGNVVWQKRIFNIGFLDVTAIDTCKSDGLIITGRIDTNLTSDPGLLLLRLSNAGNPLWARWIGQAFGNEAYSVRQLGSGNFVIAGLTYDSIGPNSFTQQGLVVETDSIGELVWSKVIGVGANEDAWDIVEAQNDGLAITGSTSGIVGNNLFSVNVYLLKVDSARNTSWFRFYGANGNSNDWPNAMDICPDGGFLLAGTCGSIDQNAYVIKTDSLGNVPCNISSYNLQDEPRIIRDHFAPVMAGPSNMIIQNVTISENYFPCILSSPCLLNMENSVVNQISISVFPNPSNGAITFTGLPILGFINIYDIAGRMIQQTPIDDQKETVEFSVIESGAYFYQVIDDGRIVARGNLVIEK